MILDKAFMKSVSGTNDKKLKHPTLISTFENLGQYILGSVQCKGALSSSMSHKNNRLGL